MKILKVHIGTTNIRGIKVLITINICNTILWIKTIITPKTKYNITNGIRINCIIFESYDSDFPQKYYWFGIWLKSKSIIADPKNAINEPA